ncbi:MAG: bacterioferritin [Deltaproteobacteria bacterium]|nr:bacterioferritin [Deltaproteobacteria bacterium]
MQGDRRVIDHLNAYLQIELAGYAQYLQAAQACAAWGYRRLHEKQMEYSREEIEHAARITRRIVFLEGSPQPQAARAPVPATPVAEQLRRDHELVKHAIDHLQGAIACCEEQRDEGTRTLFEEMLVDEESHLDWLETELRAIRAIGVERYLQEQRIG